MTAGSTRRRLVGRLTVARTGADAFRLFTQRGEREWADGWDPWFPEPEGDDTAPGTVFVTRSSGHEATWTVVERSADRSIRYARVVHGLDAGTVTVELAHAAANTPVTVTYDLTALTDLGHRHLEAFAAGYSGYIAEWEAKIAALPR